MARQAQLDRACGEPVRANAADDFACQHRSKRAVDVADLAFDDDWLAVRECRFGLGDNTNVDLAREHVVLCAAANRRRVVGETGVRDDRREIEALEPGWAVGALAQEIAAANQLIDRANTDFGHQLAKVLGDEEEVADDLVGGATEAFAQDGVLRGDADGAGVEMADAHHDAASSD